MPVVDSLDCGNKDHVICRKARLARRIVRAVPCIPNDARAYSRLLVSRVMFPVLLYVFLGQPWPLRSKTGKGPIGKRNRETDAHNHKQPCMTV